MKTVNMKTIKRLSILLAILISFSAPIFATGLDDYIKNGDATYSWKVLNQQSSGQLKVYNLELVSQTWQNIIWKHRFIALIPKDCSNHQTASLFITGSGDGRLEIAMLSQVAINTRTPIFILLDVPNQPLFGSLREDALIAYSIGKFIETGDPAWPLLLPMTKSAVRAMDAAQEFGRTQLKLQIEGFVVSGASKRGWTTWLSSTVDARVKGIAPMVYDNLNAIEQMKHQIDTWGKPSNEIHDYTDAGLLNLLGTPQGQAVITMVDPYSYLDRITIPKLIILGTNDEYWPVDSLSKYWSELRGDKYVLEIPNSGHALNDPVRISATFTSFYYHVTGKIKLPEFKWELSKEGENSILKLSNCPANATVNIWAAESNTKDVRKSSWRKISTGTDTSFRIKPADEKWTAVFGEIICKDGSRTFALCTQVFLLGPKSK